MAFIKEHEEELKIVGVFSSNRYFHVTKQSSSHANRIFMPAEDFIREVKPKSKNNISLSESPAITEKNVDDILFDMFKDHDEKVAVGKFLAALSATGLRKSDPRLKEMITKLRTIHKEKQDMGSPDAISLDRENFKKVIKENIVLISRAFRNHFVIQDFQDFVKCVEDFYWKCKVNTGGKVASYIPQLAKYNPDYWGVSICTVDGQRCAIGDTEIPFTIQSSGKPMNYAIALTELGSDIVHQYVGQEPSGRMFNELVLDYNKKPHNPMVNAGAIVICSLLLYIVEPDMRVSEKFDWICQYYKALAGGEYLGFNNATFLSEREAADRNYAIGFYMKENKCYPEKANLKDIMDFYFQPWYGGLSAQEEIQTTNILLTCNNSGILKCLVTQGSQQFDKLPKPPPTIYRLFLVIVIGTCITMTVYQVKCRYGNLGTINRELVTTSQNKRSSSDRTAGNHPCGTT
ncbi:glutaminase kidney isoform, mitochondrial-like [Uloborus diversus]|uniref:glutaminase kidney isoform, mitochondrial-like n=1 Tax=Uloborus diversus TaxID=327109 RepID=UPI002409F686|nr:glutaminase kidney isoform, mitochondrial-like [Uloborus diversus]